MSIIENLKKLSAIPGISGQEDLVREYICKEIKPYCEYNIDSLGNVIAFKKGSKTPKNKLYMSAHMDEIGFIVTNITDEGLLMFSAVGGVDSRVTFGKAVEVGIKRISGVIGGKAIHHLKSSEETTPPELDSLYIDIGATDKEEALKHVSIGDGVVFYSPIVEMGENVLLGKAFDDRAGCAIMIDLIKSNLPYDVTFGFTVQEEVGCIGGQTAAYTVNPDIGIVLESTTASDIGGVEKDRYVCRQNYGPVVSFMDRGTLYDKKLFDLTMNTAKKNNIPCQAKQGVFGGNESKVIQPSRGGVGVVAVSLPTRYIHSPSNSVDKRDITSMRMLLDVLITELAEV